MLTSVLWKDVSLLMLLKLGLTFTAQTPAPGNTSATACIADAVEHAIGVVLPGASVCVVKPRPCQDRLQQHEQRHQGQGGLSNILAVFP